MAQMPCSGQSVKVSQKSTAWHCLGYPTHGQYIPQEHPEMFTQLTTESPALISNDATSLSFATNSWSKVIRSSLAAHFISHYARDAQCGADSRCQLGCL